MDKEDKAELRPNDDGGGEVSNDIQARYKPRKLDSEADFLRLDKIRELDMLNQSASQEGSISGTQDEVISVQVCVKNGHDENAIIEGEEIVLETVDTSSHMLPVIVDEAGTSVVEEIIQRASDGDMEAEGDLDTEEPNDDIGNIRGEGLPPLQVKFSANTPRGRRSQIKYKVISNESDYISSMGETNDIPRKLIDKNDPRSRLHYVKYLKRDGKTLKIWECGICSKEFRHQYTLMRHLPTHTDERNFKCETCGKAFRQMSTLSQHRAIHSDARPYVCELCKKTFNRVSTLISHRKTHSEHKPHMCQMCGKGFHQKGNLRNHVFTHTNERPYKCELCGKGFNQMSNLMCHKAHSHGDKTRYICNFCHKEFPRRFALRSHEEYKHGIKYRGGERRQELDPDTFREIVSRKQRKREEKNLRIIHLPNGDRTLANVHELKNAHLPLSPLQRLKLSKILASQGGFYQEKGSSAGVIIDPINTKAMQTAKQAGQTPFALLKPAKGIPVLVKVMAAPDNKQMLVPATAEDLKSAGKITVSPNFSNTNNGNSIKAVQIKVPVVATVIQKIGSDGQLTIQVEPPGPEHESDLASTANQHSLDDVTSNPLLDLEGPSPKVQYVREDGSIIPEDELQELSPVNLLASAVNMVHRDGPSGPTRSASAVDSDPAPALLELASTGEIQFVRPSSDGNYEILSQEEAAQMMQQPGQTIEIVSDNNEMQLLDTCDTLTVIPDVLASSSADCTFCSHCASPSTNL
ncbi:zinc finger protein 813-like isoform X2 [Zootermopsis nevadensis]|uniref:zinc finger protein 813-like isoform X2 n=1 Tax=Zootermopsis nevadensis TaxID=136037 RepID=UPI000B8E6861|nr:zinc finger protein 813-like isoform X2 [Zootermopsis nevadensis]